MKNKAGQFLSKEQIRAFTTPSTVEGIWVVVKTWLVIAGAFALVAWQENVLTVLFAILALGSRQLSLAIIMHEGAHRTLTPQLWLNNFLGQWFGAAGIAQDMYLYRQHHMQHHRRTGHNDDPDLRLADGFPVTKASMRRKLFRDVNGSTGIKNLVGSLAMASRYWVYNVSGEKPPRLDPQRSVAKQLVDAAVGLAPTVVVNSVMFVALAWLASGWLYLLWVAAYLFFYPLVLRVRSIAEHAMTTDPDDALNNSRTTYGRWWERQLFAPLNVNYHLEHHMLPTVPFYQLPKMHEALKAAGAFENNAAVERTYADVMRAAGSA